MMVVLTPKCTIFTSPRFLCRPTAFCSTCCAVIVVFSKSRDKWLKNKLTWRNDRVYVKIVLYSSVTPLSEGKMVMKPFVTWLRENYDYRNVSWEMICIWWSYLVQNERGGRNTCSFRSPWVTVKHCHWIFSFQHILYYFLLLWFALFALRMWCYTWVQHDFHIDPIISPCQFIFQPLNVISR
jgi:hypothetical protein